MFWKNNPVPQVERLQTCVFKVGDRVYLMEREAKEQLFRDKIKYLYSILEAGSTGATSQTAEHLAYFVAKNKNIRDGLRKYLNEMPED